MAYMILPTNDAPRTRRLSRRRPSAGGAVDYRREFRPLYSGSEKRVEVVHAPRMNYLAIDGKGVPPTAPFCESAALLELVSAEVRAAVSRRGVMELAAMPVECIWTAGRRAAPAGPPDRWTIMVMQPVISPALVDDLLARLSLSDPALAESLGGVRLVRFYEGPAAQTLSRSAQPHCGEALRRIATFIEEFGYTPTGPLHEIFLDGFPGRSASRPQKLLRQPISTGTSG